MESILKQKKGPILICTPNNYKLFLIKNYMQNGEIIPDVSFITLEELLTNLSFSYGVNAIYEVMKEYNLVYDVAHAYIENIRKTLIIDKETKITKKEKLNDLPTDKITKILEIYQFLLRKGLLIENKQYKKYINTKKIIIVGYPLIKKEDLKLLDSFNYEIIDLKTEIKKDFLVYCCKNIESELFKAFEEISKLLENGENINNIYICGVGENNLSKLKLMSKFYHIPVNYNDNISLYDNEYTHTLLDMYFTTGIIECSEEDSKNIEKVEIYNEIINILNGFDFLDLDKWTKEIIIEKVKNSYRPNPSFVEAVKVVSFDDLLCCNEDAHVFIVGFNQDMFIHFSKDEDYYKDDVKRQFSFTTSAEINQAKITHVMKTLSRFSNIHISYSLFLDKKEIYPCSLISDYNMKVEEFSQGYSRYSNDYNKYLLVRYKDEYKKFLFKNDGFETLLKMYDEDYLTYNNDFTGLNNSLLDDFFQGKVELSYSSIDDYCECGFKYYLKRVLKIDLFETTFSTFIGNVFHKVLSVAFLNDFDFDISWNEAIVNEKEKYSLSIEEEFLLIKLKDELKNNIEVIKAQNKLLNYKDVMYEKRVEFKKEFEISGKKVTLLFKGIIDKLMYNIILDEDGEKKTLVSVVDYKTGQTEFNMSVIKYGLSLQLLIYSLLATYIEELPNVLVKGFFYQNILHDDTKQKLDENIDAYNTKKESFLKLKGYIIDDGNKYMPFDSTESDSQVIKSLKRKKDGGFYYYSKVLSTSEFREIIDSTINTIKEVFSNIYQGKFTINPISIDEKDVSCKYCKFKDICFTKAEDRIYYNVKKGEKDAKVD